MEQQEISIEQKLKQYISTIAENLKNDMLEQCQQHKEPLQKMSVTEVVSNTIHTQGYSISGTLEKYGLDQVLNKL